LPWSLQKWIVPAPAAAQQRQAARDSGFVGPTRRLKRKIGGGRSPDFNFLPFPEGESEFRISAGTCSSLMHWSLAYLSAHLSITIDPNVVNETKDPRGWTGAVESTIRWPLTAHPTTDLCKSMQQLRLAFLSHPGEPPHGEPPKARDGNHACARHASGDPSRRTIPIPMRCGAVDRNMARRGFRPPSRASWSLRVSGARTAIERIGSDTARAPRANIHPERRRRR
jgi:hypothetical protein